MGVAVDGDKQVQDKPLADETLADVRLTARALRERWPISDDNRRKLIERMIKIASDPKSSKREATSAFRAIVAAEAQNQLDDPPPPQDHTVTVKTDVHEAMDILKDLSDEELAQIAAANTILANVEKSRTAPNAK